MTSADGVAQLLEVGGKASRVQALNQIHSLAIQRLHTKDTVYNLYNVPVQYQYG
jgi:hypothetical protein